MRGRTGDRGRGSPQREGPQLAQHRSAPGSARGRGCTLVATGRRLGGVQAILCVPCRPAAQPGPVLTFPWLTPSRSCFKTFAWHTLPQTHRLPSDLQSRSPSQRPSLVPYMEVHSPPSICCALSCFMYLFSRLVPTDSLFWFPHWGGGLYDGPNHPSSRVPAFTDRPLSVGCAQ